MGCVPPSASKGGGSVVAITSRMPLRGSDVDINLGTTRKELSSSRSVPQGAVFGGHDDDDDDDDPPPLPRHRSSTLNANFISSFATRNTIAALDEFFTTLQEGTRSEYLHQLGAHLNPLALFNTDKFALFTAPGAIQRWILPLLATSDITVEATVADGTDASKHSLLTIGLLLLTEVHFAQIVDSVNARADEADGLGLGLPTKDKKPRVLRGDTLVGHVGASMAQDRVGVQGLIATAQFFRSSPSWSKSEMSVSVVRLVLFSLVTKLKAAWQVPATVDDDSVVGGKHAWENFCAFCCIVEAFVVRASSRFDDAALATKAPLSLAISSKGFSDERLVLEMSDMMREVRRQLQRLVPVPVPVAAANVLAHLDQNIAVYAALHNYMRAATAKEKDNARGSVSLDTYVHNQAAGGAVIEGGDESDDEEDDVVGSRQRLAQLLYTRDLIPATQLRLVKGHVVRKTGVGEASKRAKTLNPYAEPGAVDAMLAKAEKHLARRHGDQKMQSVALFADQLVHAGGVAFEFTGGVGADDDDVDTKPPLLHRPSSSALSLDFLSSFPTRTTVAELDEYFVALLATPSRRTWRECFMRYLTPRALCQDDKFVLFVTGLNAHKWILPMLSRTDLRHPVSTKDGDQSLLQSCMLLLTEVVYAQLTETLPGDQAPDTVHSGLTIAGVDGDTLVGGVGVAVPADRVGIVGLVATVQFFRSASEWAGSRAAIAVVRLLLVSQARKLREQWVVGPDPWSAMADSDRGASVWRNVVAFLCVCEAWVLRASSRSDATRLEDTKAPLSLAVSKRGFSDLSLVTAVMDLVTKLTHDLEPVSLGARNMGRYLEGSLALFTALERFMKAEMAHDGDARAAYLQTTSFDHVGNGALIEGGAASDSEEEDDDGARAAVLAALVGREQIPATVVRVVEGSPGHDGSDPILREAADRMLTEAHDALLRKRGDARLAGVGSIAARVLENTEVDASLASAVSSSVSMPSPSSKSSASGGVKSALEVLRPM